MATGLTVCYTFRLIYYSLTGVRNLGSLAAVCDSSSIITSPIILLAAGAVIRGAGLSWVLVPESYMIYLRLSLKLAALAVRVVGGVLGYMLNIININYIIISMKEFRLARFIRSMWYLPQLSSFITYYRLGVRRNLEKNLR